MIHIEHVPLGYKVILVRGGRISRFTGPGDVMLYPFESVERLEDVSNRLVPVYVDGLFPEDLPASAEIALWMQFDPDRVADGDRALRDELLLIPPSRRNEQMRNDLREAMMRQARRVIKANGVSDDASPFEKVMPALVGNPWYDRLMAAVAADMAPRLRRLGLILDARRSVQISRIDFSEQDRRAFTRNRISAMIHRRLPNLSDLALAQAAAAFDGATLAHIQEISVLGTAGTSVETTLPGPDGQVTHLGLASSGVPPAPATAPPPERERLTERDLKVLKPIPLPENSQHAA